MAPGENDGAVLTQEESDLISRLRDEGVSPTEVKTKAEQAAAQTGAAAAAAPVGLTQEQLDKTLDARDTKQRIANAREETSNLIMTQLKAHDGTKGMNEGRMKMTEALVWSEFGTAHPDARSMSAEQIDAGLVAAAKKVGDDELALRTPGTGTDAAVAAAKKLEDQNKAGEAGGGSSRSAGAAGSGGANDPLKGSGGLDRPTLGVNASTKWATSDEEIDRLADVEGKELYDGIKDGRTNVPGGSVLGLPAGG